jgi:nucleotide-binding universal stress UspA family protein
MKPKSLGKSPAGARSTLSAEPPPQHSATTVKLTPGILSLKHILVPIDFSECSGCALNYALTLAQKLEALGLLRIVEPSVYADDNLLTPTMPDETNQHLMTVSRERLMALKAQVTQHGLAVEDLVRMNRAQSKIPDTAKATGADLIVMGTPWAQQN